jgi:hypothetical protein
MITKQLNPPNDWRCNACKHYNRHTGKQCATCGRTAKHRTTRREIERRKRVRTAEYAVEATLRKYGLLNEQQGVC